jgi:hypothetical protein
MTKAIIAYYKQVGIDLFKIDREEYLQRLYFGFVVYDDPCPIWKHIMYICDGKLLTHIAKP